MKQFIARQPFVSLALFFVGALILHAIFFALPFHKNMNVIVISIDSLRADHMSLYGYGRDTTPNIDAWAKQGNVFTNYFATSFLTPISEGSVQTGDYPFTNGVINFTSDLRGTVLTIAEILKQNGYSTAAFGSSPEYIINDSLDADFSRGFDTFLPYVTSSDLPASTVNRPNWRSSNAPIIKTIDWLNTHKSADQPFYLWIPLGGVHAPFNDEFPAHFEDPTYTGFFSKTVQDEFNNVYGFVFNGLRYQSDDINAGPLLPVAKFISADEQYIVDRYDDGILGTDAMLQPLFSYLQRTGLDRSTIVILESEHGETLGERGYIAHYDIYDETLHTPLIIKIPGFAGEKISALTSGIDVFPTLFAFLHLKVPAVEGINYAPLITHATSTPPRADLFITRAPLWERITELVPEFTKKDDIAHYHDTAIRSAKWKLIHRMSRDILATYGWWSLLTGVPQTTPEYQLYDEVTDPKELDNVYAAHKNDSDVMALKTKLDAFDQKIVSQMPGPTTDQLQPYF